MIIFNILWTIVIYPIIQIIEFSFVFVQKIFKETGVSILFVSMVISTLCLPLYIVADGWQKNELKIQKKLKAGIDKIKAVFKGDEQYMMLSTFYRQNHYHPIYALRSTFGLLVQIPFFIAAYFYLSHLEALQGASFLFLNDLSKPDALLSFGSMKINILPVAMTLINIASGALYTKGLQLKDKIQLYAMAFVFLILLYDSPSGLVLYWTLNNVFSFFKNCYFHIQSSLKKTFILTSISCVGLYFIYYLLAVMKTNLKSRALIAIVFALVILLSWALCFAKKKGIKAPASLSESLKTISSNQLTLLFFISFAGLWISAGLFIPSMLISSSPQEFSYIDEYTNPAFFIYNSTLQSFGFFIVWASCLYFLFPKKIKYAFACIGAAAFSGALCNMFLFPGDYGIISVGLAFERDPEINTVDSVKNIVFLCIPLIIVLFLFIKKWNKLLSVLLSLSLFSIFIFSLINIISINKAFNTESVYHHGKYEPAVSLEPILHLSKTGRNTMVIMLDRAASVFIPYIFEESPGLFQDYSGFVYYKNAVSFNGYTRMGAPPLFGGYEYTPLAINARDTVPVVQKHNESLLLMPRLFSEADYEVVVTDPPYPNYSTKYDLRLYEALPDVKAYITDSAYTKLWLKEHDFALPLESDILKRNMFLYGLLKIIPLPFRDGLYMHGNWCSFVETSGINNMLNGYAVLDYLPRLSDFNAQKENTVLIMVNNTTHEYSFFQAPEYRPAVSPTNYGTSPFKKEKAYHTNAAAIKRLADYFRYLKNNGVYDNTRIILASDHGPGTNYVSNIGLPFNLDHFNPLLLVKDFNSSGDMKTDMTFMSNADVPSLAFAGQIESPQNPWTGNIINSDAKKVPLYIAISGSIHLENPDETSFTLDPAQDYYVHDNIFKLDNWQKADEY
ncbi:MAG: YidC/Oxa1 family membrane protein insertase [Spirochaetaceae bacterium]|jgi:YidC/Oxa1 family membrane protein insertase|nr:YidC/Oxa1 family membrane protein insertase [Spirochaetaceae bacterium]